MGRYRPQNINVILDTGSSNFWVMSDTCQNCNPASPRFSSSRSTSFTTAGKQETLRYGSEVTGRIGTDTVALGGFKNAQTFLSVDQISLARQSGLTESISGAMGFGFGRASGTGAAPFLQALVSGGQIATPEMGVWISRPGNEFAGSLILGGVNSSLFKGAIEFMKMPTPGSFGPFWVLTMTSVTVRGRSIPIYRDRALSSIDTGVALIGGPKQDVRAIWGAVGGSRLVPNMPGFWSFPCAKNVSISLSFGGRLWPIDPADMNLGPLYPSSSLCLGAIFQLNVEYYISPREPRWVIGTPFLKNVYSVFRMTSPSVGFARLSAVATGSSVKKKKKKGPCSRGGCTIM
ncbi:aspartic peptidase domain-containing protein [Infundibulicybe gibba]|nr:aspartic peptidase domain-containing protein [Infundibulicybe gibba]